MNKFNPDSAEEYYAVPVMVTIRSNDVEKAKQWYAKTLGFRSIFEVHNPITKELMISHIRRMKYQDILLVKPKVEVKNELNGNGFMLTFQAGEDIDDLTTKAKENGALVLEEPHDTAWNTREVRFQDLDGYAITLTNIISQKKSMEQVAHSMQQSAEQ